MVEESLTYLATVCMASFWLPAQKLKIPVFKDTCLTSNRYQGHVLWVKVAGV